MEQSATIPVFRILVIGANGGTGRQTVELALAAGHHVTAMLRNPANLPLRHPNLEIVTGDILKAGTFDRALENKDVAISAIGTKGNKPTVLYSRGNANLLDAMKRVGVRRAFFISASAIEISPVLPIIVQWVARYILQKLLRNMYADIRIMEEVIKQSDTDWTIVRPPRLTNKPVTGHYRFAINHFLRNCLSISRADVAHFMISHITSATMFKATVEVGY